MINRFKLQVRGAFEARRDAVLPNIRWMVPALVVFVSAFCLLSVFVVPAGKPADFNFDEGGAITALSAIFLSLACGFAIASNLVHRRAAGSHHLLWIILAFGFAFLAFDELLQFHERFGRVVLERIRPQTIFRNWNDVIVILYGLVAIPVMALLLPKLLRYRLVPELFLAAFLFYALHTLIDSTQDPKTLTSGILEESAKLFSTAFLAFGCFSGLLGNIWHRVPAAYENSFDGEADPESRRAARALPSDPSEMPSAEIKSAVSRGF